MSQSKKRANKSIHYLTQSALIATLYIVLTYFSNIFGMASGTLQLRLSEALTVLPCFMPAAIPGLFVGCLLANLLTGLAIWDIIFGSLATLLGAIGTRLLRRWPIAALLSPVLTNILIIPPMLCMIYQVDEAFPIVVLGVGVGEFLSCTVLGGILFYILQKNSFHFIESDPSAKNKKHK